MFEMSLETIETLYQLFLGASLGALVGIERSFFKQQAGLRTFALVALGATLVSLIGAKLGLSVTAEILGPIVVGVGFIGAGLIFYAEDKLVGVTTASAIWVTAVIGAAVGQKLYLEAFFVTFLAIIVLSVLPLIEQRMTSSRSQPPPA